MEKDKVKVNLTGISATMLGCLAGRAKLSKQHSSLFYDTKAIELVDKIDFDSLTTDTFGHIFNNIFCNPNSVDVGLFTIRAKQFDKIAELFITSHPRASIVNIGAGLDTTFYRVDNGLIHWYDIDLPPVIDIRRQLLPEPDRVTYIAKSLLDLSWYRDIHEAKNGVFIIAGGVLQFFNEPQVRQLLSMLADNFPDGEMCLMPLDQILMIASGKICIRQSNVKN